MQTITWLLILFLGISFFSSEINAHEDESLKQVYLKTINIDSVNLSPSEVISQPGTVITWVNHAPVPKEILFENKEMTHLCGMLTGFYINQSGQLESKKLLPNDAVNLCFIEKGKFEFTVRTSVFSQSNDEKPLKGIIWIK